MKILRLAILALSLLCAGIALADDVVINEFLAGNDTTAADQDGEYDDWIELFNNSTTSFSLNGYHLTDESNDPTQWTFPDTTIPSHGYMIVWADEDENQHGLHANFKISASGEALYLTDTLGLVTDSILFGVQTTDVSYGRYPNGTGSFRTMYPTFSAANRPDSPGYVDSTEMVFGDTLIHSINLEFYTEHWQDTLQYNFEVLDKEYMPARLTYDGAVVLDSIGVRYKGNSSYQLSRNTPKKPFEFKFDKYIDNQAVHGVSRVNVQNAVSDPSFMRETIAYSIARRYMPAPRTAYSNVFVNDTLLGFYVLVEQVDKVMLARYFQQNGGNLFKAADDGATLLYRGSDPASYAAEYELKTNEEENDWSGLISLIDQINNTPSESFVQTLQSHFNFDRALHLLAFNMALSNFDSYTGSGRNFYLYDDPASGQFHILPWDFNESFGVYPNGWDVITQDINVASNFETRPLCRQILENDSLRQIYQTYILQIINGPASLDSITATTNRLRPLIEDYVQADTNKLYDYADFVNNIEHDVYVEIGRRIPGLKSFVQERGNNIRLQLSSNRVYPGDTDNNGIVNALDVLPIGVYFLQTGALRDSASVSWGARRALLWETQAATYADANGDGTVDEQDVVAIGVNWTNTHAATTASFEIDPTNASLLAGYAPQFRAIYNSLSGAGEAANAIKHLIESIYGGSITPPVAYALDQNYPNPFNQETVITFALPDRQEVTLSVMNILGQMVSEPVSQAAFDAGQHSLHFNAAGLTTGIYIYRLHTDLGDKLHKMVVLK
jgi:hypothetical protein